MDTRRNLLWPVDPGNPIGAALSWHLLADSSGSILIKPSSRTFSTCGRASWARRWVCGSTDSSCAEEPTARSPRCETSLKTRHNAIRRHQKQAEHMKTMSAYLEAGRTHGDADVGQQRSVVLPAERFGPAFDQNIPSGHGAQHRPTHDHRHELPATLLSITNTPDQINHSPAHRERSLNVVNKRSSGNVGPKLSDL